MSLRFAAATLPLLSLLAFARPAYAVAPITFEFAPKAGYGDISVPSADIVPANALGFGLGARAGVALHGFYVGASLINYAGATVGISGSTNLGSSNIASRNFPLWSHELLAGGEVGYGLTLHDFVTIRPQVGLGEGSLAETDPAYPAAASTAHQVYVEPGVALLVGGGHAFLGVDANVLVLRGLAGDSNADAIGWTAHLQLGFRL